MATMTTATSAASARRIAYKALLRSANRLDEELLRCEPLRARELALLRRAARTQIPAPVNSRAADVRATMLSAYASAPSAVEAVRTAARDARPVFEGMDNNHERPPVPEAAFRALKHLSRRVHALEQLVYTSESEHVTAGVRVRVVSSFIRYDQNAKRYCFQYDVAMKNESKRTLQLVSRRWHIHDLNGVQTQVDGPGVVGQFPVLNPGDSFQYSSGTPLATPLGTQAGHFVFVAHNDAPEHASAQDSPIVNVQVAPFALQKPLYDPDAPPAADSPQAPASAATSAATAGRPLGAVPAAPRLHGSPRRARRVGRSRTRRHPTESTHAHNTHDPAPQLTP